MASLLQISRFCAASSYLVMIIIMLLVPRPKGDQWRHFCKAINVMLVAYFVLMCSNIFTGLHPSDTSQLKQAIILTISSYQALFFTVISLVFIQPQKVTRRFVTLSLLMITAASVGLIGMSKVFQTDVFQIVLGLFIILYLLMCAHFSLKFIRHRNDCLKLLEEVYAEEMDSRIRWITRFFFTSLFVGLLAATETILDQYAAFFTLTYALFYAYFIACLLRYQFAANYLLQAVKIEKEELAAMDTTEELKEEKNTEDITKTSRAEELTKALEKWVTDKEYAKADIAVADIAQQLGTNYSFFTYYFSNVKNTSFRTWRLNLRIEEAKRLMIEEPDLSISEIIPRVGYNQRGNFYRHFQSVVGCSPNEFREQNKKGEV